MIRQINCCQSVVWQSLGENRLLLARIYVICFTFLFITTDLVWLSSSIIMKGAFSLHLHVFCGLCWSNWKSLEALDFCYMCSISEFLLFHLFCKFWPLNVVSDLLNRSLFTGSWEFFSCFVLSFLKFSLNNLIVNSHGTGWVHLHLQGHYLIDSVILK